MKQKTSKKWKLLLWSIISTFALSAHLNAQNQSGKRQITGTVYSAASKPVELATVIIKGTGTETSMMLINSDATAAPAFDGAFDNFRVVKIQ